MLGQVVRGESVVSMVNFETPESFSALLDPTYEIRTHLNTYVDGGSGIGTADPNVWQASFVIPYSAPATDLGESYSLKWQWAGDNGSILQVINNFIVVDSGEAAPIETGKVILASRGFTADIYLDEIPTIPVNYVLQGAYDKKNYSIIPVDPSAWHVSGNGYKATVSVPSLASLGYPNSALAEFVGYWTYGDDIESNTYYMVNEPVFAMVSRIRGLVDKARNYDINPNLIITDRDIVWAILNGVDRVNGLPPRSTDWTLESIPRTLIYYVYLAAAVEICRAQYLAEGMSAFNFTAPAVQLDIDRTQYWQTLADQLDSQFKDEAKPAKTNEARKINAKGQLLISIHANTNYPLIFPLRIGYMSGRVWS